MVGGGLRREAAGDELFQGVAAVHGTPSLFAVMQWGELVGRHHVLNAIARARAPTGA